MLSGDGSISTSPVGTGTLTLGSGATLRSNNSTSRTLQNNLSLSGNITIGSGVVQTGALTFNSDSRSPATVTLTGDTVLSTNSTVTITNEITGPGKLTKTGPPASAGTLILVGENTFTGGLTLSGGLLHINRSGISPTNSAIGTGTFRIDSFSVITNTNVLPVTLATNNTQV